MKKSENIIQFPRLNRMSFKTLSILSVICFCVVLSGSLLWNKLAANGTSENIEGTARVIDGDTLEIGNSKIRIHGIDAPESAQTCLKNSIPWLCGREATAKMRELVMGAEVRCQRIDTDRYGRIVGKCFTHKSDIAEVMVSEGMALAYRQYSKYYIGAEASAKASKIGLWSGEFIPPWDWRRGGRLSKAPANDNQSCDIKGNISRSGKHIYHIPGGYFYARTKISKSNGDRWFCSEEEAREAGWRRSSR